MKKLISLALLGALAGFGNIPALALDPGYTGANTFAEDDYAPTMAQVNFYIETSNKNLVAATDENKKISQKVLEAVKKELSAKEEVKTVSFNAQPEYSYKDNKKNFEKYTVSNAYQVKVKDISKIGKIIGTALDAGATRIEGLNYTLDATEDVCNKLTAKALTEAKGRAENVAKTLGMKLGGVKQISTYCNVNNNYYPQYRMMSAMAKDANGSTGSSIQTEAGTINVRATVDAQFYIVP